MKARLTTCRLVQQYVLDTMYIIYYFPAVFFIPLYKPDAERPAMSPSQIISREYPFVAIAETKIPAKIATSGIHLFEIPAPLLRASVTPTVTAIMIENSTILLCYL